MRVDLFDFELPEIPEMPELPELPDLSFVGPAIAGAMDALAGFGILLDHLHDALDFGLHGAAVHTAGIETHYARAHSVNQLARWMIESTEKVRLFQRGKKR